MKNLLLTFGFWITMCVNAQVVSPRIVAHQGFHLLPGTCSNSRASLKASIQLGTEGSEMDVWLTADDKLVVHHDANHETVRIEQTPLKDVKKCLLENGETLPEFNDFLAILKKSKYTKLFVEIKTHSSVERTVEAALATVKAVHKKKLQSMVEYMSFSQEACKAIAQYDNSAQVYYLKDGKSPEEVKAWGVNAMNYKAKTWQKHPDWIVQAHKQNMQVTARGCNNEAIFRQMVQLGVDNVASDQPQLMMKLRNK